MSSHNLYTNHRDGVLLSESAMWKNGNPWVSRAVWPGACFLKSEGPGQVLVPPLNELHTTFRKLFILSKPLSRVIYKMRVIIVSTSYVRIKWNNACIISTKIILFYGFGHLWIFFWKLVHYERCFLSVLKNLLKEGSVLP